MRPTHSGRLERYVGASDIEALSRSMRDWYGPPIAVGGVPGEVYACGGGDFIGPIDGGYEVSMFDRAENVMRRLRRAARLVVNPQKRLQLNMGFAALSDLLSPPQMHHYHFIIPTQGSATAGLGKSTSFWGSIAPATIPVTGTIGDAAPGGRVPVGGTDGGFNFVNAPSGMTSHFVNGHVYGTASIGGPCGSLLLYDRLFDVAKTQASTTAETVSGVPSRYQNVSAGNPDSVVGNFAFVEAIGITPATAHNWDTCTYKDQDNTASTFPLMAGLQGTLGLDHPQWQWFVPLAAGDTGVKALTQMQCSASITVAGAGVDFVIGHPLAWMPNPVSNVLAIIEGVSSAMNLVRIFDDACLHMIDVHASTGQTSWSGGVTIAAGG